MTLRQFTVVGASVAVVVLWWRLRPEAPGAGRDAPEAPEPRAFSRLASSRPAPPRTMAGRIAAYVWASPLTTVGVLLGTLSRTRPRAHDGVLLYTDVRGVGGWMLRWRGFAAATLGHAILVAGRPGERLLEHELVHVRQAERWGPLFVPLYLAGLVRYGYRRNPFERAAYGAVTPA